MEASTAHQRLLEGTGCCTLQFKVNMSVLQSDASFVQRTGINTCPVTFRTSQPRSLVTAHSL